MVQMLVITENYIEKDHHSIPQDILKFIFYFEIILDINFPKIVQTRPM